MNTMIENKAPHADDCMCSLCRALTNQSEQAQLEEVARRATQEQDDHFGLCPHCLKTDYFLNVYKDHYYTCDTHKVFWKVGYNLLSSWQNETQEDWDRNAAKLATYTEVKPGFLPATVKSMEAHRRQQQRVLDLFEFLSPAKQDVVLSLLCEMTDMEMTEYGFRSRGLDDLTF